MRAHEFLNETKMGEFTKDTFGADSMYPAEKKQKSQLDDAQNGLEVVEPALPNAYVIPDLQNNDYYELYRFSTAIARARGDKARDEDNDRGYDDKPDFDADSKWGDQQFVSSEFDDDLQDVVGTALKMIDKSGMKPVSTLDSHEMDDIGLDTPQYKEFEDYGFAKPVNFSKDEPNTGPLK